MECLRSQLAISNYFLYEQIGGKTEGREGDFEASAVSDRRSD